DEPLLDEVLAVAAREEVRARLQADEAGVTADQHVHGDAVAVPGLEHELQILKLPLSFLRRICVGSAWSHGVPRGRGRSLTLRLRAKIAKGPRNYKLICTGPNMMGTYVRCGNPRPNVSAGIAAAPQTLEPGERLRVEPVAQVAARTVGMLGRLQLAEEAARRELAHLLAGRASHSLVRGDDGDLLARTMLGGEALDRSVGVGGPAHGERPVLGVLPVAVEDEHAARALRGDPARQEVAQLLGRAEAAGVEQVEAVEEVERRLSHRAAAAPRRAAPRPRRSRSATRRGRPAGSTPRSRTRGARAAGGPCPRRRTRMRCRR